MTQRNQFTKTCLLFFLCFAVYMGNGRAHPEVDCVAAPYTAWQFASHGTMDLRDHENLAYLVGSQVCQTANGQWLTIRPPGSFLACLPVLMPLTFVQREPPSPGTMHMLGKVCAALSVAFATVVFFRVVEHVAPTAAWPAAILFGLGTCLTSVASQAIWTHGPATLWMCLALWGLVRPSSERPTVAFATGLALGMAVLTRPTTAYFALATGIVAVAGRQWRRAIGLTVGGCIPLVALMAINKLSYGHPFLGGYVNDDWNSSTPLWFGLSGLLFAPSRGLFVYSPALILGFAAVPALGRRNQTGQQWKPILASWMIASIATACFYATWHDWRGGWCYGPRFLCETMPAFCLLFAAAYDGFAVRWWRSLANVLVAASVYIHVIGIYGYGGYVEWHNRHERPDGGRSLFEIHDTQIEAHSTAFIRNIARLTNRMHF